MSVLPSSYERIYPLVMVVWCVLIFSNLHNRMMDVTGSWRRFRFESDEVLDEGDGSSSAGIIILRRGSDRVLELHTDRLCGCNERHREHVFRFGAQNGAAWSAAW